MADNPTDGADPVELTTKQRTALRVLLEADAAVEALATTAHPGGVIHRATAEALAARGLIELYQRGARSARRLARLTAAGRVALGLPPADRWLVIQRGDGWYIEDRGTMRVPEAHHAAEIARALNTAFPVGIDEC